METQNYSCKKCGLTITSICSKCDRVVDVKVLDNGCIVQKTKCEIVQMYLLLKMFALNKKLKYQLNFFFDI